jgi:hypothetical protein
MRTPTAIQGGFYTDEEAISSPKMRTACLLALSVVLAGCSSASSSGSGVGTGATGNGGSGAFGNGGTGGNIDVDGATGGSGGFSSGCSAESQFVYVLDSGAMLYRFNPPTLEFTPIGLLNCPTVFGTPFSMAVDRDANAWVVYTDGAVFQVNTTTAVCTPTAYQAGQQGWSTFGMGFSTAGVGSTVDGLFVSDAVLNQGLATIDTQSLQLQPIGAYDQLAARAELTGTGDGRLFGAFEGAPYIVAEIDKSNAHIISQAPQDPIQYAPSSSNFAFAFWGGTFWLFVGPGTSTDVFHYDPVASSTTLVKSVPQVIVGAGVSTCAPITPPE